MESTLIVLFFSWYLNHIWHCYRSSIESHPLYCRISLGQSIKQKDQDEVLVRLASYRAIQCPQRRYLISYRVPYMENELRPRQWLNPNRKRALDDVGGAIRTRKGGGTRSPRSFAGAAVAPASRRSPAGAGAGDGGAAPRETVCPGTSSREAGVRAEAVLICRSCFGRKSDERKPPRNTSERKGRRQTACRGRPRCRRVV